MACVSVSSGFDWLCFVTSALFADWLCRFSILACLFSAKVLVNWVCKTVSASLALSVFCQSQVFQNFRSGLFVVLIGEVLFFSASVLVNWLFCVLVKIKVACKIQSSLRCRLFGQRFWSAGRLPNKACTRRVGFCAIYRHFSGFGFFLHLKHCPRPPTRG